MKIETFSAKNLNFKDVDSWPVWEKEISSFDWFYDSNEYCFILEGEAKVKTDFEEVTIKKGDFVKFPKGLNCFWEISKPIRKHYKFE